MKLYRTDDETSISGTVAELQRIRNRLNSLSALNPIELNFDVNGSATPYEKLEPTLTVCLGRGPACLSLDDKLGLLLIGNKESIGVFSSFFDFESGSFSGSHLHWDECCNSTYTSAETISLVVSVA